MFSVLATCLARQARLFTVVVLAGLATLVGAGTALAQNAYVPNQSSSDVTVINTATNTVVATIPVGSAPRGVGVTPDGTRRLHLERRQWQRLGDQHVHQHRHRNRDCWVVSPGGGHHP